MSALIDQLLAQRGIEGEARVRFLDPDYTRDVHHFSLLPGIDRAVDRVLAAMRAGERIAIYADFDCDGIPGAVLLSDTFRKIGYGEVEVYIPHRDTEGHGVHEGALGKLSERGVRLVITVDVGVSALDAARFAQRQGLDLIVTDHHEPPARLPECVAVINPKLGDYPFRELCGAAVAWKLACALIATGRARALPEFEAIPEGWEKWLLDLVAIATVADLVPLLGENRVLVHYGLRVLRKSPRVGLRALFAAQRIKQAQVTEDDISFSLAPRINAASRMDEPMLAFELLDTHDASKADALVASLESLNAKRKGAVAHIVKEARKRVGARYAPADQVVVLGDIAWKPSLAGLVANTLVGERGGLVCIWGETGNGELKGSCRSDGTIPVVEVLSRSGVLIEYGGHDASGGFSVSREHVHELPDAFARAASGIAREAHGAHAHDAMLSLRDVSWSLYEELARLAPFGIGNEKPVFRIRAASIRAVRRFGKEKNHTEVEIECFETGARARAFDFFRSPEDFSASPSQGRELDVVASLSRDTFRGERALALRLVDLVEKQH
jgi:single-stranded-DNA-specific exonuclease